MVLFSPGGLSRFVWNCLDSVNHDNCARKAHLWVLFRVIIWGSWDDQDFHYQCPSISRLFLLFLIVYLNSLYTFILVEYQTEIKDPLGCVWCLTLLSDTKAGG